LTLVDPQSEIKTHQTLSHLRLFLEKFEAVFRKKVVFRKKYSKLKSSASSDIPVHDSEFLLLSEIISIKYHLPSTTFSHNFPPVKLIVA